MSKLYVGDSNSTSKKPKKSYVGYNGKSVQIMYSEPKVYGVAWDGSAATSFTRLEDAKNFSAPNPYYAGMSGTPSSPFDDLYPWCEMKKSENSDAGTVVAIPKFYYKMEYASGTTGLKLWIADKPVSGFKVSPRHADCGDGAGERDVTYVGRYHCASDYKSKTGASPKNYIARNTARTGIHALGSNVWQWDYATYITIVYSYLVEFADWNCRAKIGYGVGVGTTVSTASGSTDSMPYHTGIMSASRSTAGIEQYRYIESLWDVVFDHVDGIYGGGSRQIYLIKNPSAFGVTGGTLVGTSTVSGNYPTTVTLSSVEGYEYPLLLNGGSNGSSSTYIPNHVILGNNNKNSVQVGGTSRWGTANSYFGIMSLINNGTEGSSSDEALEHVGSRLMVLP